MTTERRDRTFLAVALDDVTRHSLAAHLDPHLGVFHIGDGAPPEKMIPGSAVPIANWHLTLRVLGATTELQRDLVLGRLAQHRLPRPFRVRFGSLGAFPNAGRATVLWLGVDGGAEDLADLAAFSEDAAQGAGFGAEDRPFHPHLTLSRIRPPEDVTPLVTAVPPSRSGMLVEAVTLFRTRLGGGPARYEVVDEVPLG
jgi:2'-5' RNA ligase